MRAWIRHFCVASIISCVLGNIKCLWMVTRGLIQMSIQWRQNGLDSVLNHQPHDCLLKRLFRHRSKKHQSSASLALCVGNSPETGEFPTQRASYAENVSIWWRHHGAEFGIVINSCTTEPAYCQHHVKYFLALSISSLLWEEPSATTIVFHVNVLYLL